jgi:hypothetical protein
MDRNRKRCLRVVAAALLVVGLGAGAFADEKIDPTGSWKLSMAMTPGQRGPGGNRDQGGTRGQSGGARAGGGGARRGGQGALTRAIMLNLKQKDGKISGDFVGFAGKPAAIKDAKLKDGELSFKVPQQMGPATFTITFVTKLVGDKMQGTAKITTPGGMREFPFQGERLKTPTVRADGTWKLRIAIPEGPTFDPTLKIAEAGNSLKGVYAGPHGETPITNALVIGDEVTFDVARDRGDKKYRLHFQGKIKADALAGNVEYDFDGMNGYVGFTGARAAAPQASADKSH